MLDELSLIQDVRRALSQVGSEACTFLSGELCGVADNVSHALRLTAQCHHCAAVFEEKIVFCDAHRCEPLRTYLPKLCATYMTDVFLVF